MVAKIKSELVEVGRQKPRIFPYIDPYSKKKKKLDRSPIR